MPKNEQKVKTPSVFNYKCFKFAIAIPIFISVVLMWFIWQNDNLSLEWPSKKSLETFFTFMSIPLWIMGSAIPFATLAAANFRAIQFQENLEYQKRNLERQEYEHALDLYHKELTIFKEITNSVLKNENFKLIKPEDTTLIFINVFKKPLSNKDKPLVYDLETAKTLSLFMIKVEKLIVKLDNCSLDGNTLALHYLTKTAPKYFSIDIDAERLSKDVHISAIKLALLVSWFTQQTNRISNTLGVQQISIYDSKTGDILSLIEEVIKFYTIIYNSKFALEKINIDIHNSEFAHHFCSSKISEWKKDCNNSFIPNSNLRTNIEDWKHTLETKERVRAMQVN